MSFRFPRPLRCWMCPVCHFVYRRREDYRGHYQSVHDGKPPVNEVKW